MSFISNAVKGLGQGFGLLPDDPTPALGLTQDAPLTVPTAGNSSSTLDDAALSQAKALQRGRTSTMLTGGEGTLEDQKYTSKVLLGR